MSRQKPTYQELEQKVLELEATLTERVKELYCISELSKLVETKENTDDILTELASVLKQSMQFPAIAEVKITNKDFSCQTKDFKETPWTLSSDIIVDGEKDGEIQIVYLENSTKNADPFLKEEDNLLGVISERTGKIIERSKKNRKFGELFDTLFQGILWTDNNGIITDANPEAAEISGYGTHEELIGRPIANLYTVPEARDEIIEKLKREGSSLHNFEFLLKRKDGSVIPALCNIRMSFNQHGEFSGTIIAFSDVSNYQKIKNELIESEERYKSVFEKGLAAILVADDNGNYISVNQAAAEMFGYEVHELRKMNIRDLVTTTNPGAAERYKQYLEKGEEKGEFEFITKKREHKIAIYSASRIRDDFNLSMLFDITKRKKAEQEVKESEAKFRELFDRVNDAIFLYDPENYEIIEANKATSQIYGYTSEELVGMSCLKFSAEVDESKTTSTIAKGKGSEIVQLRHHVKKDGKPITVELFISNIYSADKKLMFAVSKDISLRLEAIKVKESEARFKSMFESHNAIMLLIDPDTGAIMNANETAAKFYGYTKSALCSLKVDDLNALSAAKISIERNNAINENRNYFIFPHKLASGEIRTVEVHSSPIEFKNKRILFSIIHDITEREKAENALKESEEQYKNVVETTSDLIANVDTNGVLQFVNHASVNFWGLQPDKCVGLSSFDFIHPEDREHTKAQFNKWLSSGETDFSFENRQVSKTGNILHVYWNIHVERKNNKVVRVTSVARDVTEQKKAEQALLKSEEKYKSLTNDVLDNQEIGVFILDADFHIVWINSTIEQFFGISKNAVIGKDKRHTISNTIQYIFEDPGTFKNKVFATYDNNTYVENFICTVKQSDDLDHRILEHYSRPIDSGIYRGGRIEYYYDITERKKAEQALIESEEKLKIWINNSPVCTKVVDPDFNLQFMSDSGVRELKINDITEYYGKPYPFHFYPDSFKIPMKDNLKKVKETGEIITQEASVLDTEGVKVWYRSTLLPVYKPQDKLDYILVVSLDITESKNAEESLNNLLIDLKLAQNIARIGNWQFDPQIGIPVWSDVVYEIYERNPDKGPPHLNEHVMFFDEEQNEIFKTAVRKAVQEGIPYDIVLKLELPGNRVKWVRSICKPQQKTGDAGHFLRGTLQDITKQKQAEEALKESEERLRLISDNIPKGQTYQFIIQPNGHRRFTYVSKKVEDLHECTAEQVMADPDLIYSRVLPEYMPGFEAALEKSVLELCEYDYELKIKRKSGEIRWHRMISRPRKLSNGDILFDGIDLDITSQKEHELQLEEYSKELRKLNEDKDKLFSIIGHDLKGPLHSLSSFSNLLINHTEALSLDEIRTVAKDLDMSLKNLFGLIENLLNWARAQTGRLEFEPERFNLAKVINESIHLLSKAATDKKIKVEMIVDENVEIFADINSVKTVIRNLLSNAIKFTNVGGAVTLNAKEAKGETEVSVVDTGVGMREEALSNIFNSAINKSEYGTANEKGTGLGLQICKEFIEKHGGKIWAESELGNGSVFYFTIPKQKDI